uniref:Uncharacterized protein n=1 Tax=Chrysotila carterae TaxID=13221 RepID=A0A7S4AZ41_CHRCT
MLHMPSHIDMRDGDYASSVRSNAMAVALPLCRHAYPQHNMESLLWSARMADDLEVSLDVAKQLAAHATATCHARVDEAGMSCERFTSQLLLTLVHFEMWDDIQMKHRGPPPSEFRYWRAVWLFAQGMAATRGSGSTRHADTTSGMPNLDQAGRMIAASRWLALLQSQRGEVERAPAAWTYASLVQLVAIYEHVLRAEIMLLDEIRTAKDAVAELEMALLQQTLIPYDEPPALYRSVRPRLADILMRLNDTNSARAILRAELYEYPNQPFLAAKCARLGPPRCGGGAEQLVAESHADVSPRVLHLRVFPICIALVTIFLLVLSLCAVFLDKADWVPSGDRHTPSLLSSARGTALC